MEKLNTDPSLRLDPDGKLPIYLFIYFLFVTVIITASLRMFYSFIILLLLNLTLVHFVFWGVEDKTVHYKSLVSGRALDLFTSLC